MMAKTTSRKPPAITGPPITQKEWAKQYRRWVRELLADEHTVRLILGTRAVGLTLLNTSSDIRFFEGYARLPVPAKSNLTMFRAALRYLGNKLHDLDCARDEERNRRPTSLAIRRDRR